MAVTCGHCAGPMDPKKAKYCSQRCRTAASRARNAPVVELSVPEEDQTLTAAVKLELEAAGRADTSKGRAALALARMIDGSTAVMGYAALVKQWEASMEAALAGVKQPDSPVIKMRDELAARRGA